VVGLPAVRFSHPPFRSFVQRFAQRLADELGPAARPAGRYLFELGKGRGIQLEYDLRRHRRSIG
jgi:hypothetical protein